MCIIIYNKAGNVLPMTTLRNSADANPDGFGLMYAVDKKLVVYKTMKDVDFIAKYSDLRSQYPDINMVLHFRIGTSGSKNLSGCHPYMINDNLAFCHNGIIREYSHASSDHNDTWHFNEDILKGLPPNFLENKSIERLIFHTIGSDKLCFLDNLGQGTIFGYKFGHDDKLGNWYSNDSYKEDLSYTRINYGHYDWEDREGRRYTGDYCVACGIDLKSQMEQDNQLCENCMYEYGYEVDELKREYAEEFDCDADNLISPGISPEINSDFLPRRHESADTYYQRKALELAKDLNKARKSKKKAKPIKLNERKFYNKISEVPVHIVSKFYDNEYQCIAPECDASGWSALSWINWIIANGSFNKEFK